MKKIVQHPSTPKDLREPEIVAERLLAEMCPLMIELIADWEFDIHDEDFARDFRIVVEILRAILYGQLGVQHDLQIGLGSNNPLKKVTDDLVQQDKIKELFGRIEFVPVMPITNDDDE